MIELALQSASKILDILYLFHMDLRIRFSPQLRAPYDSLPYIRHDPPQVLVNNIRLNWERTHLKWFFYIEQNEAIFP